MVLPLLIRTAQETVDTGALVVVGAKTGAFVVGARTGLEVLGVVEDDASTSRALTLGKLKLGTEF